MAEEEIGIVEHWFGHISVAALKITKGTIKVGDTLHYKGHTTDFQETITSMQIEHEDVPEATVGDNVAIRVSQHARVHDKVYKVT